MHTNHDHARPLRFHAAWATLAAFAWSCGGPTPAQPSQQPPSAAAPTLTTVSPATGATTGGLAVTITGTGFVAGATVTIGGAAATNVSVSSATSVNATTPARSAGAADIVVTNPDGQSGRLTAGFNYQVPASDPPAVAAVAPSSGPAAGGTSVSITGSGFAPGAAVAFGTMPATSVNVLSATSIAATAPAGSSGIVDLVVTNSDGQSSRLTGAFTYLAAAPPAPPPSPAPTAPTLSAIAPSSGSTAGGTGVTLTGSGFVAGATVTIGGNTASNLVVASATSITATTPAHAAGAVDVVVTNPDGLNARLAGAFTYTAPAPPPPAPVVVVTITTTGVGPSPLTIAVGSRVRFVNNDTAPHEIASDPHLQHTQCPEINAVGVLLPGQSRETDVFTAIRTCGYHDHRDADDPRWTGTIQVR